MTPATLKPVYTLTNHTWTRCQQMGLTRRDVIQIIEDPEVTYTSWNDRMVAARGEYAVVYNPANHAVVTVLHRTTEVYLRPEAERFQWAGQPQRVLAELLRVSPRPSTPTEGVIVASKVLTYFGIPSDIIVVALGTPLSAPRQRPAVVVDGTLVDLPYTYPLPDSFWMGDQIECFGVTYTYLPDRLPEIWWEDSPNESIAYIQEQILDALKEQG